MSSLPPETELVVCCARWQPDTSTTERIQALSSKDPAWAQVIREALSHSTMPLLYRNLSSICPEAVPVEVMVKLRELFEANAQGIKMLTRRLVRILDELARQGIPAIPIKGPALAASAYGDITLRQWGDLDILVPPDKFRDASRALVGAGLHEVKRYGWQATFAASDEPVAVDLHRAITEPRFPVRLGFDELWSRCGRVDLEGRSFPNLSPEDTLFLLCVQLVKDGWDRRVQLSRVGDVAHLQKTLPPPAWPVVVELATKTGARRIVHLALLVAHDILGSPPPPATLSSSTLSSSTGEEEILGRLAERIRHDLLFSPDLPPARRRAQHRFHLQVRERTRDKLFPYVYLPYFWRTHVKRLATPTERDRQALPLPRQLSFLYYLVRPVRAAFDRGDRRSAKTKLHRAPELTRQTVDGRDVLADCAGHHVVTLNQLGALVWEALEEHGEPEALAAYLLPRFEGVGRMQLEEDVTEFLEELRSLGLVVETTVHTKDTTAQ